MLKISNLPSSHILHVVKNAVCTGSSDAHSDEPMRTDRMLVLSATKRNVSTKHTSAGHGMLSKHYYAA